MLRFNFAADAGTELILSDPDDVNACEFRWRVLGPDADDNGEADLIIDLPGCFRSDPVLLPADGDYVLVIDPRTGATGPWSLLATRS